MKVVIDTNVLVSALINEHGAEAAVLFAVADGKLTWCVSSAILAEYEKVLLRPKFSKIPRRHIATLLRLAGRSLVVIPTATMSLSPDESDNRFYECAAEAEADYIVTGNTRHFPRPYNRTKIFTARQLLKQLSR